MADTKIDTPKAEATAAAPAKAAEAAPKPATKTAEAAPAPAKPAAKAVAASAKTAAKSRTVRVRKTNQAPKRAASAAAKTTNRINQGTRTMNNEAKQAADRFQAVFGEANERAKNVIERNSRIAEELTELTKGNVEAMVASTKVVAKGVETLGQEVAEFGRKSFEDASAALKRFAEVKSPTDLFRLQSDFARTQFDSVVAETSKLSETVIKLAGEVAQPITSRYSVAAERVRTAVAY